MPSRSETLYTVSKVWRRRFFESAFCKRFSLHGEHFELRDRRNVTTGVGSGAGGGELGSQETSGIVGFEEMRQRRHSANLVPLRLSAEEHLLSVFAINDCCHDGDLALHQRVGHKYLNLAGPGVAE